MFIKRVFVRNGEVETLSPDKAIVEKMDAINIRIELDGDRSAEQVGRFLANVSRVIAQDYVHSLETERADGNLFNAICESFVHTICDGCFDEEVPDLIQ